MPPTIMKKLTYIIAIILICMVTVCDAATLTVPFRCNERALIRYFKEEGINLDKQDWNSDGFIENCGRFYKIHFYKDMDMQEFLGIHMKVERRIQRGQ